MCLQWKMKVYETYVKHMRGGALHISILSRSVRWRRQSSWPREARGVFVVVAAFVCAIWYELSTECCDALALVRVMYRSRLRFMYQSNFCLTYLGWKRWPAWSVLCLSSKENRQRNSCRNIRLCFSLSTRNRSARRMRTDKIDCRSFVWLTFVVALLLLISHRLATLDDCWCANVLRRNWRPQRSRQRGRAV